MVTVGGVDASIEQLKYQAVQSARDEFYNKGREIAQANNIEQVHVQEGAPEMVVNEVADNIDAGIIVLGTIARTGVSGMFIGNTAEAVMEGASADVFVVKHADFVSPLA
jgi:nucleotide-binding universal stress UspA family protein